MSSVGTTLTGGIQDISALLPLLGTDQCETHVGSALDGGYLYAAAAPMSIFGSLGIVKTGMSILISSISIPKLHISYRPFSIKFSQDRFLGARTLNNAGFEPAGTVAALIAMDGTRYKAETRLMEILEEKHLDNPENVSIEWKSRKWNVGVVLFTIVAGVISGAPYIAILLQPAAVNTPWIFPLLRTVGSCLVVICCQFLIQSRVISLMKNRIIFLIMNHVLIDNLQSKHKQLEVDLWLKEHLQWDVDLPAEQCLWSLQQFLSRGSISQPNEVLKEPGAHASIPIETLSFSEPEEIRSRLQKLREKHFPRATSAFDRAFDLITWIILCLALPATAAGYIGCFTLVSASQANGPVIWLGLEAALSIVRIMIWAWNPGFDEDTEISVTLELSGHTPLVTTEKSFDVIESTGNNTLALVPEQRFLEWITPYTGPLEQFQSSENLALKLYFTLSALSSQDPDQKHLIMTVFDLNKQIAIMFILVDGVLKYGDPVVTYNQIASEMEAALQPDREFGEEHPWGTNNVVLIGALTNYYKSLIRALNRKPHSLQDKSVIGTQWEWNLLPKLKHPEPDDLRPDHLLVEAPSLHDKLYLGRGHEHHLKTLLIKSWSEWMADASTGIRLDARNDCHHALADAAGEKAKWELTELDSQLTWELTKRELSLVVSSITLEGILVKRMKECIEKVTVERGNGQLKEWMWSEFVIGQRKRLEKEKRQAMERMEKEMKSASDRAEREGRPWKDQGHFKPLMRWEDGLRFIGEKWSDGIKDGQSALENAASELDRLFKSNLFQSYEDEEKNRLTFVEQFRQRFEHWRPHHEIERRDMDTTIKGIKDASADSEDLVDAYDDPYWDPRGFLRFLKLERGASNGRVCSAIVYDVVGFDKKLLQVLFTVIQKSTTRSVTGVDPDLVDSIPENDHLLYIGTSTGKEPAFIRRNRDHWWDQQTSNSSTFYFSPQAVDNDGQYVISQDATIAHIFIFLVTPSRLRLRLLHCRDSGTSVSIQENGNVLRRISTDEIQGELRLQDFELDEFKPGRHELELVPSGGGNYFLRDIFVEFFDDTPSRSSVDKEDGNLATMEEHGGADADPSGISDTGPVRLEAIENDVRS